MRRRNPVYSDPYTKEPLSDAVTMVVGLAITAAIIGQLTKSSESLTPLTPEEFMAQTVKPVTVVADRVVPPSADHSVAQTIQNPPIPAQVVPQSTPTQPVQQAQDVCLQWDLAHATPGGTVPCLRWGTTAQVVAQGPTYVPPLPAVPVPASFVPEISKLQGIHPSGDFGRRI